MTSKIFKPTLLALVILLTISTVNYAQVVPEPPAPPEPAEQAPVPDIAPLINNDLQFDMKDLNIKLKDLQKQMTSIKTSKFRYRMKMNMKNFDKQFKHLNKNLTYNISKLKNFTYKFNDSLNNYAYNISNNIGPQIALGFKDFDSNFTYSTDIDKQQSDMPEKVKNYSKTYSVDGNDKLKIDNQYGRITVNTWDRHEVKVDIQIKASANRDEDAQSLLDGVQISDSKSGDLISFRTDIERRQNGRNKNRKIEVNYIVNMPAKMSLDVENSYGSIILPNLDGLVKISTSYTNVVAQNLSNPANIIEGSYGSIKIGVLNGGKLDYSYGSVELAECTNLKADVSYGSLNLGKVKGRADLDLSYMGGLKGLKIGELDNSLKKLNINSSYSDLSINIPDSNNFDFDVTVSYAGFNFNNDKVTITSKPPVDGSKGWNPTKSYRGHFGKGSAEPKVIINSSYGSVKFN
jgi:hypothetical protein